MTIKVCLLSPFYPNSEEIEDAHIGGVERYVSKVAEGLATMGVNVTVISSFHRNLKENISGVEIIRLKRQAMLLRNAIFPWKKHLNGNYDLIHAQGTYPFLSDTSAKAARRLGIPSVLSYHFDAFEQGAMGSLIVSGYYGTLGKSMGNHTSIIAATRSYARASRFLRNISKERLEIIPYGIDPSIFKPEIDTEVVLDKYGLKDGYALFVGRLVPYKGLPVLVDAAKSLDRELVVVGDGPLREMVRNKKNIRSIGFVDDGELPAIYAAAGVTTLPSVFSQEAFGICLLESMACGTPVVGSDLAGVKEVASLGGKVVPKSDSKALASAINDFLRNGYDRAGLSKRIRKEYSWQKTAERVKDLYVKLIDTGVNGS